MPRTQLERKTISRVDVSMSEVIANGTASQPDEKRKKTIARLARISSPSILDRLLDVMTLGARDHRFELDMVAEGDGEITRVAQKAIEQARADDPNCIVNGYLNYAGGSRFNSYLRPEPSGVTFLCTAENCCQKGLLKAVSVTKSTIQENNSQIVSEMHLYRVSSSAGINSETG